MEKEPIRIYADTSVFGGVFDEEFAVPSRQFFEEIRDGRFHLMLSALVEYELIDAPAAVRQFFEGFADLVELSETPHSAVLLRDRYVAAGIVGPSSVADAFHVALATVLQCKVIVSWNFRHIVHFDKIPRYNRVNRQEGFPEIAIHTPHEVIGYAEEEL